MKTRLLNLTLLFGVLGGRIFSAESPTAGNVPEMAAGEEPSGNWEVHLRPFMREKPEWYVGAEAVRIADNVLLYQCDSGGIWNLFVLAAGILTFAACLVLVVTAGNRALLLLAVLIALLPLPVGVAGTASVNGRAVVSGESRESDFPPSPQP